MGGGTLARRLGTPIVDTYQASPASPIGSDQTLRKAESPFNRTVERSRFGPL